MRYKDAKGPDGKTYQIRYPETEEEWQKIHFEVSALPPLPDKKAQEKLNSLNSEELEKEREVLNCYPVLLHRPENVPDDPERVENILQRLRSEVSECPHLPKEEYDGFDDNTLEGEEKNPVSIAGEIWEMVKEQLSKRIPPAAMLTWFDGRNCEPIDLDKHKLLLRIKREFTMNVIEVKYSPIIVDILNGILPCDDAELILVAKDQDFIY